jgi:class 3 adenylate cyclase
VAALEERKVVSVLFCDLVGFTAASEAADPEDVRARIRPYHARLREVIERYGGTVEKFVGDAVMAVFGAPVAHEDDAERAVRAGLRILEAIAELNDADPALSLQVRVGINTGEAVVALGARPEEGEGIVTGDVVNTASRLRLLPTPGSPTTVTSWHEVCCAARSNVPIRSGFSNSLPTKAVAYERVTSEPKRARAANGRYSASGAAFPFTDTGSNGSQSKTRSVTR